MALGKRSANLRITARATLIVFVSLAAVSAAGAADYEDKSVDELARDLANPNTPLTSIKLKTQYRSYAGDLAEADEQHGTTLMLQPTLPFPLDNGKTLYVRPGIPFLIDQPVVDGFSLLRPGSSVGRPGGGLLDLEFGEKSGLGDTTVDVQYGETLNSGFLWSVGATMTAPTATDDSLGTDRWALGPGFQLGKVTDEYVLGGFANHQWDIGGSGDVEISLTTIQFFAVYLPGGGWSVASAPILTYDHESHEWNVPLNFAVGKTMIFRGRPWKFAIELNYYVDRPDRFAPRWMVGLNIAPVVENDFARWLQ